MIQTDGVRNVDIRSVLFRKAVAKGIPLSGTFELTPLCNFNCRMCYIHMTPEQLRGHSGSVMQLDDWLKVAQQAKQLGTLYILLTGGEPLLWPDFWELYDALYRMGFLVSVNTNGSMITDEIIQRFAKQPPYRINLTLYGACDETYQRLCGVRGMYDRVTHAIEGLHNAGVMVKLNCSLTPENAADIQQMLEYAARVGVTIVPTAYMFPPLRSKPDMVGRNERFTPEQAAEIRMQIMRYKLPEKHYRAFLKNVLADLPTPLGLEEDCADTAGGSVRCMAGRATFWATWNGYMSMCGMISDERLDLKAMDFEQAWKAVRKTSCGIRLADACSQCESRQVCNACAAKALTETGKVSGIPTYLCEMVQEMKKIAERELSEGCKQ